MNGLPSALQRAHKSQDTPVNAEQIRGYARALVSQAPPLTAEQRVLLKALLHVPAASRADVSGGAV
ncbi:MAG: hypothetical protein JO296_07990 [Pseudonocardiales bacterium]|nr:hypothetical protein [Pseudonocardiales bacterium]